ncbi:A disintegrin and metalloproteinase with thrombospondin motifs 1, partial [Biomphalaria glabrata]
SVCYDNTSFTYDGLHCQGLMQRSENLCYNQPVQKSCCESCSVRATTIAGCEYGNRDTTICRTVTSCKGLTYQCCQKCGSSLAVKMEITSAILMYLIQHIIV